MAIHNRCAQQYHTHLDNQYPGNILQAQHRARRCIPGADPAIHGDAAVSAQVSHRTFNPL